MDISGAHFQPVLVPDDKVRHYIRTNRVCKGDKVLLYGQIRYRPFPDDHTIMTGHIYAVDVVKIATRSNDQLEFNANDTLNVEN